jgi:hypothetical protein
MDEALVAACTTELPKLRQIKKKQIRTTSST